MPTDVDYQLLIETADNAQLNDWLAAIRRGEAIPGWDAGRALEYIVLRQFQIEEAEVTWPFSVMIEERVVEQIDGAVYADGLAWLVECKDYGEPVNVEPLAKLRNQLLRRPCGTLGMVFNRSDYTGPAKILARYMTPLSIILWEFAEVEFALKHQVLRKGLQIKYRYAVEKAMPDYNILGGL